MLQRRALEVDMSEMHTPEDLVGNVIAQGLYRYTIDDRTVGMERWRMTRLENGQSHLQILRGNGSLLLFGIDLLMDPDGQVTKFTMRVPDGQNGPPQVRLSLRVEPLVLRGQVGDPTGLQPFEVPIPPGTLLYTSAIAAHLLIGRAIDMTSEADQPLTICDVALLEQHPGPGSLLSATATVLGEEPVELLMATVSAQHVLFEIAHHAPQHAWFDEHRLPVRWYWVGPADGTPSAAHELSLERVQWQ